MPLYIHFFCYYRLGVSSFNVYQKIAVCTVNTCFLTHICKFLEGKDTRGGAARLWNAHYLQLHKVMSGCPPGCHSSLFPPPPPPAEEVCVALYCHSTCSCQSLNFASHYKIHFFMCHFSA